MSSSTFEVRESESDSEKVHDFGIDTCEENGIMSTQIDGELPKDHTYTKEPDVLQEDGVKDSDHSSDQEDMDGTSSSAKKSKTSKVAAKSKKAPVRTKKSLGKGKPKKNSVVKILLSDTSSPKKVKKEEDEANTPEDVAGNGEIEDASTEASNTAEAESKAGKRGRKRKIEEKENLKIEETQNTANSASSDSVEKTPKKKAATPKAKAPASKSPAKVKNASSTDGEIDSDNLPKGWLRKKVVRKSGKTAGHIDVYIYSPDGFKLRSKPDIVAYLARTKSTLKIEDFDFTPGKIKNIKSKVPSTPEKSPKKKPVSPKLKTPVKKKPQSTKKSPKLLVKIVSAKPKKSRAAKESPEKEAKESKSEVKGKGKVNLKGNKKKKNA